MFPAEFDYYKASSVSEALDLMEEHADEDPEIIAGGHSLLPTMKSGLASPGALVDVSGIDSISGIEADGDETTIGAMTNYVDVVNSSDLAENVAVFPATVEQVGDVQVRNRGTIGGNLAHADPASDLPAAALAADATIVVEGRDGEREVPVDDFFLGMYATDVGEDELLTGIRLPNAPEIGGAYAKKPSPSSGYAMVGVAAALEVDGDEVTSARVAANGVMDHGIRLEPVEDALVGGSTDEDSLADAADHAGDDLDEMLMMDDVQASAEFRAHLLTVYTKRALGAAVERANGGGAAAD
ncbi:MULTISPECIES: xanthine dehydrogenase family protein subunit M [unclassified Haladaptatus]|uniref:FAD binding domain-containing protein n=1 Tax=unclassified Haladaptatus TaxID=2622732 RepID=UPI00209BED92|nr:MULTISPECIES: xanthine dehydrogenase family protein subunit M [unclassified Haladaptatus]MCO8246935.1 xanthine dehydrogenase family protein subunit M [Haladaptatus sp. AB643]MCO8253539.1 xanthine dehydrogenase family protein subunit M [Haladaptatus sp. AB618]